MTSACRARFKRGCVRCQVHVCVRASECARGKPLQQKREKKEAHALEPDSFIHAQTDKKNAQLSNNKASELFFQHNTHSKTVHLPGTSSEHKCEEDERKLDCHFFKPPSSSSSLRNTSGWQGG